MSRTNQERTPTFSPETTAARLAVILGQAVVGRRIETEAIGDWEGGVCTIIKLDPDPAAPEIVFEVRRDDDGEEIGVFAHEGVRLIEETS